VAPVAGLIVAILWVASSANQRLPSGPVVISPGDEPAVGVGNSVIAAPLSSRRDSIGSRARLRPRHPGTGRRRPARHPPNREHGRSSVRRFIVVPLDAVGRWTRLRQISNDSAFDDPNGRTAIPPDCAIRNPESKASQPPDRTHAAVILRSGPFARPSPGL